MHSVGVSGISLYIVTATGHVMIVNDRKLTETLELNVQLDPNNPLLVMHPLLQPMAG